MKLFNKKPSRSKYGSHHVIYDNIKFDSEKEKDRYIFLKDAESKGMISNLELQPKFEIVPAVHQETEIHLKTKTKITFKTIQRAITYTADFKYVKNDEIVVEDVKMGKDAKQARKFLPKDYLLKKKMMLALLHINIREVHIASEEI